MIDFGLLLNTISGAVGGAITGTMASLIAPWVNWRIENIRARTEYRRQQVRRWRETIDAFDFATRNFADTAVYSEIRPYLDQTFREEMESGRVVYVAARGRGENAIKHRILDAITERERAWNLI